MGLARINHQFRPIAQFAHLIAELFRGGNRDQSVLIPQENDGRGHTFPQVVHRGNFPVSVLQFWIPKPTGSVVVDWVEENQGIGQAGNRGDHRPGHSNRAPWRLPRPHVHRQSRPPLQSDLDQPPAFSHGCVPSAKQTSRLPHSQTGWPYGDSSHDIPPRLPPCHAWTRCSH